MNLTAEQEGRLRRYAALVRATPHNLLSKRGLEELDQRHIPESVVLASVLPAASGRLLDVGSGGGLPGIVIAICRPDLEVVLLEGTAKKAKFLVETAADLGLDLRVVNQRAEHAARGALAGSFDIVTARAVAPLARLIPWTVPFLTSDGRLYAVKGRRWAEELSAAEAVLQRHRARLVATPADLAQAGFETASSRLHIVIIARL